MPAYFYINFLFLVLWWLYKSRVRTQRLLLHVGYLLHFNLLVELCAWTYSHYTHISNHFVYNIYTTIQLVAIFLIYKTDLLQTTGLKKKVIPISIAYVALVALNLTFVQSFWHIHTITYVIGCLLLFYFCISYFRELLESPELLPLHRIPAFWFNCANLICYLASMMYMGSVNFIVDHDMDVYGTWVNIFVYSFTSLQYLLYIAALVCTLPQKRN